MQYRQSNHPRSDPHLRVDHPSFLLVHPIITMGINIARLLASHFLSLHEPYKQAPEHINTRGVTIHHKRYVCSQQLEIVQLVAVLHDGALDLAGINPGHEVLHIAINQISRVRDDFGPDSHVALFDECNGLVSYYQYPVPSNPPSGPSKKERRRQTYRLNSLHHPRPNHHNRKPSPTERRDRNFPLDLA